MNKNIRDLLQKLLQEAKTLSSQAQYKNAIELYEHILKLDEKCAEAHYGIWINTTWLTGGKNFPESAREHLKVAEQLGHTQNLPTDPTLQKEYNELLLDIAEEMKNEFRGDATFGTAYQRIADKLVEDAKESGNTDNTGSGVK